MFNIDQAGLKALLLDAKERHTCFEKEHGPDKDWAEWYATYMLLVLENENAVVTHPNGNWGDDPLPAHAKKGEIWA